MPKTDRICTYQMVPHDLVAAEYWMVEQLTAVISLEPHE